MQTVILTSKATAKTAASHAVGKNTVPGWIRSKVPPVLSTPLLKIQPKLKVNVPGDKFEKEADAVADKVVRLSEEDKRRKEVAPRTADPKSLFREKSPVKEKAVAPSRNLGSVSVSRKPDEQFKEPTGIQKKDAGLDTGTKSNELAKEDKVDDVESRLMRSKGGGQPLPLETKIFMSRAFGADFNDVRVHTDGQSAEMNKAVKAHAFTHGKDIYFNSGMYDPGSPAGMKLLAHELSHVVQQGAAPKVQKQHAQRNEGPVNSSVSEAGSIQRKSLQAVMVADPAYQNVVKKVKTTANSAKKHDPASKKVKEAQSAAKPPANEKASKAKDKKTDEMDQQEPGKFDEEKFKAALREKIAALQLNTLQEAEDFKKNNGAAAVKGDMQQNVDSEKNKAAGNINNKTKEAPDPSKETGKDVGPKPVAAPGVAPPAVDPIQAAPKPVPQEEISLDKGSMELDQQMSKAKITDKQLQKSNEPKFLKGLESKNAAQKDAREAPQKLRKDEKSILTQSQQAAGKASKSSLAAIAAKRKNKMSTVLSRQEEARLKDEQARAKVAADIEQKFAATKTDVENILSQLDKDVGLLFDQGIANATKQFEDYVDREVRNFKIDRYLNQIGGSLLWAYDLLKGPPDEINDIYKRGKDLYIRLMDGVINKAAALVVRQLNAAKKRINAGKQEIKTYVASLPKNLQKVGAEAAKKVQSQFADLESSIDNKQSELVDTLADKYKAGLENVDKKIAAMKEANKGLIDRAKEAIGEIIDAIIEFKNLLLNVLAKAAEAIDLILDDPIGFLGNLIAGVKAGIQGFASRIWEHLKAGLMSWLFGTLASAGIQLPQTFDLKGILSLILQVLGLTYANIRSRAVNILGEKVVVALEKAAEVFIIIKNEGIGGLWRFIKEKVEDLKDTVLNSIKEFVVQKIVVAGITWIIGLLNPASAFIKACKLIYDVIMFFVTRAKQIVELVNAVVDSVTAIAKGAISVAANAVENALAKALPVVLGFLASLLGLDGISDKIKAIIAKIQAPINAAIDWVINKAVSLVKNIAGFFKGGKGKEEDKKSEYGPEKQAKIDAGLITMKQEQSKYIKGGKISREDAGKVAAAVKANHPVFNSFTVEEKSRKISFYYTASPKTKAEELEESDDSGCPENIKEGTLIKYKSGPGDEIWSHGKITKVETGDQEMAKRLGTKCAVRVEFNKDQKTKGAHIIKAEVIRDKADSGYTFDLGDVEHTLYKPKNLKGKGTSRMTYETFGGASFVVEVSEDKLTKTVKGTKLQLKQALKIEGRGVTERSEGFISNESLNAAHIIADQFLGSGYREGANLATTSAEFNKVMTLNENLIKELVIVNKATEFNMDVTVTFGELLNDIVVAEIIKKIPGTEVDAVKAEIQAFITRVNPAFKRVMNVKYVVNLNNPVINKAVSRSYNTGPDLHVGLG